ncbi:MAG: hypothetical protein HY855_14845 [Burkholderiales bacterium]|nr:hypothetical protein [Burkholderiales bacterium]
MTADDLNAARPASPSGASRVVVRPRHRGAMLMAVPALLALLGALLLLSGCGVAPAEAQAGAGSLPRVGG